jgi:glycosyltransferase involved in cell wall biosynthesis
MTFVTPWETAPVRDPPAATGHVAVDATAVVPGLKGVGRFQRRLLRELAVDGRFSHVTALTAAGFEEAAPELASSVRTRRLRGTTALARDLAAAPRALRELRPAAFVTTSDRVAPWLGVPSIVYAFEDPVYRRVAARLTPETGARQMRADAINELCWRYTARAASRIVAASASTARDLVFRRSVPPGRVTVAMPGPFGEVGTWAGPETPSPYVLAFADLDPRDNAAVALEGFAATPEGWRLKVVGRAPDAVREHAGALGLADRVDFLGRVPDAAIRGLFEKSQIYLDVSLYEGYGAQAAEAVACGVPSIVAANTSLPETTGYAAVYVNAHDPATVASAVARLAQDPRARRAAAAGLPVSTVRERWGHLTAHLASLISVVAESSAEASHGSPNGRGLHDADPD